MRSERNKRNARKGHEAACSRVCTPVEVPHDLQPHGRRHLLLVEGIHVGTHVAQRLDACTKLANRLHRLRQRTLAIARRVLLDRR